MTTRLWIVAYDIAHPRRLRRIAAVMEGFGSRAQKSVFECWLDDAGLNRLQARIQKELDPNQDSVRYYPLCADCRALALNRGGTETTPPKPYYIV